MPTPKSIPVPALLQSLKSGERSIKDLLAEIEIKFSQWEPKIQAFLPEADRLPRLEFTADTLLDQYPQPKDRPPLFGLPIGVKDIFHVDGYKTRAGSSIPPERLNGREAEIVTILKKAGALVYGKTVTTEFAYFGPGPTRNPHNLAHTPGGSSSGSAAAVAAGILPFALGSQTIGSINRPASFCGVVGFKPTYDRISKVGVIPVSQSVDTIGYFAPDVGLAHYIASVLLANWREIGISTKKPVLGIPDGPYLNKPNSEMMAHFENTIQKLKDADYTVKNMPAMADFEEIYVRHNQIVAYEAALNHAHWLPAFENILHPKTIDLIQRGQLVPQTEVQIALDGRRKLRTELTDLMIENQIDLWISPPALGAAPKGLTSTGDPIMNLPWTHCGFPTLTLPSGFNAQGLPLGTQISGQWMADEELLVGCQELAKVIATPQVQAF